MHNVKGNLGKASRWLDISARLLEVEREAHRLRAERRGIKSDLMRELNIWGLSDDQVTHEISRNF
jgi:hypothetical protein